MEKMVTDKSVTHVLVFSDSEYAAKADARKAGVGTESQIISGEVYSKVQQSKFIPIVCELDQRSEPSLPTFLKSRIWIDFSSPEAANQNWEQLIRVLFGKPAHEKPVLGKPPTYVTAQSTIPSSPAVGKFLALRQAIIQNDRRLKHYRQDFLGACYEYADTLRTRARPDIANMGEKVLADCGKLKTVRDHIADWVLIEAEFNPSEEFGAAVIAMLERLLELKSRPPEVNSWNDVWFDAHKVFVYETFLYIVAALIKSDAYKTIHLVLTSHYLLPEVFDTNRFGTFYSFYGYSEALQVLAPQGKKLYAPAAELIKRQADRNDLPFADLMQSELLILMMAFITNDGEWFPQTLHYSSHAGAFPLFLAATRHRDFQKIVQITGISSVDKLRESVKAGQQRLQVDRWNTFGMNRQSLWVSMNMDALNTLE